MSKLSLIVFSPTGGTRKVADIVAKELADAVDVIDLCDASFDASKCAVDELSVVAMPSFGGRAPQVAVERLAQIVPPAGAKCVLVCVYGNRAYEDTLVEMQDVAAGCGFEVAAAIAAVAEHSIMHQFAMGRPDEADCAALVEMTRQIGEKLDADGGAVESVPGSRPYREAGSVPLVPRAKRACNACGLCAKSCPVGAIDARDPKVTDDDACISCMRCVSACPQKARKVNGFMVRLASLKMRKACSARKECELFL